MCSPRVTPTAELAAQALAAQGSSDLLEWAFAGARGRHGAPSPGGPAQLPELSARAARALPVSWLHGRSAAREV
ncbi:MAG: hypothetical protein ACLP7F_22740 [Acidimicrobiales bacterium]